MSVRGTGSRPRLVRKARISKEHHDRISRQSLYEDGIREKTQQLFGDLTAVIKKNLLFIDILPIIEKNLIGPQLNWVPFRPYQSLSYFTRGKWPK